MFPNDETPEEVGAASSGYESIVEVSVNEYNGLNQLINTTNIKDGERTFASYLYNGDGLRVQKTVDGTATDYVYSGNCIYLLFRIIFAELSSKLKRIKTLHLKIFPASAYCRCGFFCAKNFLIKFLQNMTKNSLPVVLNI